MTREKLITSLQKIVKPYIQDQIAFENLTEETDFINDLKMSDSNNKDRGLEVFVPRKGLEPSRTKCTRS